MGLEGTMTVKEADRAALIAAVVEKREARVHQSRPRRARLGELVRVDGSPHDWFEGRGRAAR